MNVIKINNNVIIKNKNIPLNCLSYVDKPIVYVSPARCLNMKEKDKKSRKFFFVSIQTEFKPFNFFPLLSEKFIRRTENQLRFSDDKLWLRQH